MLRRKLGTLMLSALLLFSLGATALATHGYGSFLYHRLGYSIGPTYKYYWTDGTSLDACPPTGLPPDSRKFAPEQAKVQYSTNENAVDQYWTVQVDWDWTNNIGQDYSNWEANTPISGDFYFLIEAHVSRGWLWQGYYQENVPQPINHHTSDDAIYKDTHVEADIWTEAPTNFVTGVNHKVGWTFSPAVGEDFSTLSRAWGQGFKITIYRWWNAIHVASGHGDPMDLISWKDELGTFGPNDAVGCSSATSTTATTSTTLTGDDDLQKPTRSAFPEPARDGQMVVVELKQQNLDAFADFVAQNDIQLQAVKFTTEKGGGYWINRKDRPTQDLLGEIERVYGVELIGISQIVTTIPESEVTNLRNDPVVSDVQQLK